MLIIENLKSILIFIVYQLYWKDLLVVSILVVQSISSRLDPVYLHMHKGFTGHDGACTSLLPFVMLSH